MSKKHAILTEQEVIEICRAVGRNLRKELDCMAEECGVTQEQLQAEIDKLYVRIYGYVT